jgi:hypothetical protein
LEAKIPPVFVQSWICGNHFCYAPTPSRLSGQSLRFSAP